jgi:hypothetical protein
LGIAVAVEGGGAKTAMKTTTATFGECPYISTLYFAVEISIDD